MSSQFRRHEPHIRIYVAEEYFVPGTEIIEAGLTVGRLEKAMPGTFAVAGKAHVAFAAVFRKARFLRFAEWLRLFALPMYRVATSNTMEQYDV